MTRRGMAGGTRDWRADWLTVHEAVDRILAAAAPLEADDLPIVEAVGRTLAESVAAPVDHPPWDNSAMDGYAVRAADIAGAGADRPINLPVTEEIPAGGFPTRSLGPGEAAKIMTGAPLPAGADSVVRVEHTEGWQRAGAGQERSWGPGAGESVVIVSDADAGRNVRRRGESVKEGEIVLRPGTVLRPGEIGVLAMVGRTRAAVHRPPRVAILSNGDELVGPDRFDEVLAGRKIVDSNTYALAAAVAATGGEPVLLGIAGDDAASLRAHLRAAAGADVLITTAGASVGEHDLIKDVLGELGFELDFWRVRIQPGSPISFGRLGGTLVFGLPGNPVSALVTFEVLVRPALRRMLGRTAVHNPTLRVRLAEAVGPGPERMRFLRAVLEPGDGGEIRARLAGPQGSGILTSVSAADALVVIPIQPTPVRAGEVVTAIPLRVVDEAQEALGY